MRPAKAGTRSLEARPIAKRPRAGNQDRPLADSNFGAAVSREEMEGERMGRLPETNCEVCGRLFAPLKKPQSKPPQTTCSRRCAAILTHSRRVRPQRSAERRCGCGAAFTATVTQMRHRSFRCPECERAHKSAWVRSDAGRAAQKRWRERYGRQYFSEARKKYRGAHLQVHKAIKRGALIPQPCEVCGDRTVEAHHDDYEKPLDVRWLCKAHHEAHHSELKRKAS